MSDESISSRKEWEQDAYTGDDIPATAPLYKLIKVDVHPQIVRNNPKAHTYAKNHCNSFEYELVDYLYPNEEYTPKPYYPFIKL